MVLAGIQLNRDLTVTTNRADILRDGNVVYGKITKLFPNQKAEVQIGEHKMIAQITTPLAVGDRHFFQVQHHQGVIELKVLGERLQNIQETNIADLLNRLGINNNKINREFVQSLIHQRIPFTQAQLNQALAILATIQHNQAEAAHVLQHMIQHRLPMNESVFQALFTQLTQSLTENMHQIVQQLQQQPS